ncbi:MAG: response regulator [Elusimicrobia bacterium]|nr:response regulator [Elusimicrobiota bacterium]
MAFILHIDDDPTIRALMFDMLSALGYECDSASSFAEGLERARRRKPDLIILDVMMPVKDGFTGCRELRQDPELKIVPVIMLTALDKLPDVERAFAAGANDFMTKPVLMNALKAKVEKNLIKRL